MNASALPSTLTSHPSRSVSAFDALRSSIAAVVRGKDDVIDTALVAMLAGGHLLLEDIPGVGKSTLARTLARSVGGEFRRIQFTSDLLPADVLGGNVWRARAEQFEFRPGPIFANFVLADEINRAPPRTQSALLEAMGEQQVSIDGRSHPLPRPFMVLATQNPLEHYGTYPLPESQRDRFTLRLSMGYAADDVEAEILRGDSDGVNPSIAPQIELGVIVEAQDEARRLFVHEDIAAYAQAVVGRSRSHPRIRLGVSTRGALAWIRVAKARAYLRHRPHVSIDDLQDLAVAALAHRIVPSSATDDGSVVPAEDLVRELLLEVPVPV